MMVRVKDNNTCLTHTHNYITLRYHITYNNEDIKNEVEVFVMD